MSARANRSKHITSNPLRAARHIVIIVLFFSTAGVAMAEGPRPPCESTPVHSRTRVGHGAKAFVQGHEASYINRAVAMFRHIAGILTDQNPPAAP